MNTAPVLKKAKEKKEEAPLEDTPAKKVKHISKSGAKRILSAERVDDFVAQWCEQWIDNFVRTYSYPPQLVSNDFLSLMGTFFPPAKALDTLSAIRADYRKCFWGVEEERDFQYLVEAIRNDPTESTRLIGSPAK